jgi:PLD-like domain/Helicase conserved C-terminal domain/SNF2-related domain
MTSSATSGALEPPKEFATNDASVPRTVAEAINELLAFTAVHEANGRSVAIASAYFNVDGWKLLSDELRKVGKVRLMLGAEPQRETAQIVLRPGTVSARKAASESLQVALLSEAERLAEERNLVPFTPEAQSAVAEMINWLRSGKVEVRRYTSEFLHGKAYMVDHPILGVIAGSSNFTFAGLHKNRELNLGQYNPSAVTAVRDWFNELWKEAEPFDLAGFYEQRVVPDEPWLVFLRMLWESYGQQLAADDEATAIDPSMRDLLPFQKDGVGRARRILDKYNGVLIADEVGLGKTYVGGALVRDTVRSRKRVLIVAPKIIRDSVWKPYIDERNLAGWVDVVSYDDLLRDDSYGNPTYGLPPGRDPNEYALVLLDEAHTVRNSDTQRAERLVGILKGNPRKQVVLLTATPVNNTLGDLHSLLSYFIVHDDEFSNIGIPSLAAHFKEIDKLNPDDLSPEHLFDILDAVAVRRTRRFVRNHYVGQRIDESSATLAFPEPVVRRVDYDLSPVVEGFFGAFAHALGADLDGDNPDPFFGGEIPDGGLTTIDPARLTLAGYTPSRYRYDNDFKPYEAQIAGLLRSGLLKRFESSGYAFVRTCRKMADTLSGLVDLIDNKGYVASAESLRDWMRIDLDDLVGLGDWLATADYEPVSEFRRGPLLADIRSDIAILQSLAGAIDAGITPETDPKLIALSETLVRIVEEAKNEATVRAAAGKDSDIEDRDDRKVLVFSYFADTIYYLQDNIDRVLNTDPALEVYRDRVAFVTGSMRRTPGHGAQAGTVTQEDAVAGFAPRTGGPRQSGHPIAEDRYDLLCATDVLSEGVNLQQARNIVNYDLPWNPMRLVQRHGRVDRIGSMHSYVYLWCFFPDRDLDKLLRLENILHTKLAKAAKSIGAGKVLPGVDASDDVVFNAKREQIQAIADEDNALFLGVSGGLISGEEFRAMLHTAAERDSLTQRLQAMPWGVGSGFAATDRAPGFVFCARILNRANEPAYRFVALPPALLPGHGASPPPDPTASLSAEDLLESGVAAQLERPNIGGTPVDLIADTLTALTVANPPDSRVPAIVPAGWKDLAYQAWAVAQNDIVTMWNNSLDPSAQYGTVAPVVREAVRHLGQYGEHHNREDIDLAMKVYSRGQAARVTAVVRSVMRDTALTDRNKTDRLIELVDEMGLSVPDTRPKRFAIDPSDVHLIAWMAIVPGASIQPSTPASASEGAA